MGDYFVRIDGATDVRRKILESSKASIHILRSYQQLEKTRGEKLTMLNALRKEMKELTMLVNRMEELIPTVPKAELLKPIEEHIAAPPPKKGVPQDDGLPMVFVGKPSPPLQRKRQEPKPVKQEQKKAPPVQAPPPPAPEKLTLQDKLANIEAKLKKL